ncbi:MAG: CoA transferase, partial [Anaerolineales bacterium]|nr:CoA transferase [Anaerolineales bacterium]
FLFFARSNLLNCHGDCFVGKCILLATLAPHASAGVTEIFEENYATINWNQVLDLSRVLAGPYCTMVLGDLGADVIKVEPPEGDETRGWGPPFAGGESAYYLCVNRNKRGMVVNLKTEAGKNILRELAMQSDVLVENFRPGTLKKFGLDFETLHELNPRLIYCSITGFGQTGSMRDKPGYDFMIQAMGGVMSITGEPEGEPMKAGVAVADLFAGQNAVIAILAALQARAMTGLGQQLDISLFDSQLGWLANVASNYLISSKLPKRHGNAHPNIVPYQSFQASDGWFAIAVGNDKQFEALCKVIGKSELGIDPRFAKNSARVQNRDELIPLLKSIFATRSASDWLGILEKAEIPCGPINNLEQVFSMPLVKEREMLVKMEHPTIGELPLVGSPLKINATPVEYRLPPPLMGEHTEQVLKELGYWDDGREV